MQEGADENYKAIIDLVRELQSFYDEVYEQYEPMAERLCKRNASEAEVADFLEKLLDYCMDVKFVSLYKTVCRRYYAKYTQMVSEYVYLYLDLYQNEETDEMENEDE